MRRRYLFSAGPAGLRPVPVKQIWYTSTSGQAISLNTDNGLLLESNLYSDGKGVMRFSNVVTLLPANMFANSDGCKRLETVSFPASVTRIGYNALTQCIFLKEIILCGPPPSFYNDDIPRGVVITVPDALLNDYMTDGYWGNLQTTNLIRPWSEHI